MMLSRRSLLKGIAAAIAAGPIVTLTKAAEPQRLYGFHELPIDQIHDNPVALRHVDKKMLKELAASIEKMGLLNPVTVRNRAAGGYELIDGLHRIEALRMIGRKTTDAYIVDDNARGVVIDETSLIASQPKKYPHLIEQNGGKPPIKVNFPGHLHLQKVLRLA